MCNISARQSSTLRLIAILLVLINVTLPAFATRTSSSIFGVRHPDEAVDETTWAAEACHRLRDMDGYISQYSKEDGIHLQNASVFIGDCLRYIPAGKVRSEIQNSLNCYYEAGFVQGYAGNPSYRSGYTVLPPKRVYDIFTKYHIAEETARDGNHGLIPQDLYETVPRSHGELTKEAAARVLTVEKIIWEAAKQHTENAEAIAGIEPSSRINKDIQSRFLSAIDHNQPLVVAALLKKGASLNKVDLDSYTSDKETPVMRAASGGRLELVKQLLNDGATLSPKQASAVLGTICLNGYNNTLKILMSKGADVNTKNHFGTPVLTLAVGANQQDTVNILLAAGAALNEKDNLFGSTPLIEAAISDKPEMVRLLLNRGADKNATNNEGQTALAVANKNDFQDIVDLLRGTDLAGEAQQ